MIFVNLLWRDEEADSTDWISGDETEHLNYNLERVLELVYLLSLAVIRWGWTCWTFRLHMIIFTMAKLKV